MIRILLILTVVLLSGFGATWLIGKNNVDPATAAFHSGPATPGFPHNPKMTPLENGAYIHPVIELGPRKPAPGKPLAPPSAPPMAPSQTLPPRFPAETTMPPELLKSQKLAATPSPLQSFPDTFEGRMGKLNLFSRTNAWSPPPSPPPAMQILGRVMAPPNTSPGPTPSVKQLRDYLLQQPGGREILEESLRRKLRLSQRGQDDDPSSFSVARLFIPEEVQAAEGFKAVFTPKEPKNSGLTFTGIWQFDPYRPVLDAGIRIGGPQAKTLAAFNVNVPRPGAYFVSVQAYASNVKATLKKAGVTVKEFDYGPGSNYYGYWALVDLAAGSHTFYWYVDRGTAEFVEVSVQENV